MKLEPVLRFETQPSVVQPTVEGVEDCAGDGPRVSDRDFLLSERPGDLGSGERDIAVGAVSERGCGHLVLQPSERPRTCKRMVR